MQEWLTVILVLLIAGVILDGIRRMRQSRKHSIKTSTQVDDNEDQELEVSGSEFPTGGARVAGYRDEEDANQLNDMFKNNLEETKKTVGAPDLEGSDEPFTAFSPAQNSEAEPALGNLDDFVDFDNDGLSQPRARERGDQEATPDVISSGRVAAKPTKKTNTEGSDQQAEAHQEVIIIHVVANSGYVFSGDDLLRAITAEGMRFGEMDIFHRHENEDGSGSIMFSMVNMLKPGTFDLSNMDTFETPGVSLFMNLPIEGDSLQAFRTMTKVAKGLIAELGGEMKDEFRSVMTPQTIEHCRQRVIEFDRRQRLEKI